MKDRDLDRRLEEARRRMPRVHAGVEPDAHFARRVVAALPPQEDAGLPWAAWRGVPVSVALALALAAALAVTARGSGASAGNAPAATAVQAGDDLMSWVLEGRESSR